MMQPENSEYPPLRVGVARTDITPDQPVTLAGYQSRTGLSQGVHDPLSARAVAFEHDGRRLVLVSTDILGFYGRTAGDFREAILAACGLQPGELFLSAIHTHSAPNVAVDRDTPHPNNVAYVRTLQQRLIGVVTEALAAAAPARIAVGRGACPVGANRREVVTNAAGRPEVRLGRNPALPTDPDVQVLKVSRADADGDEPAAVVFAYATHSTSLGPGNLLISGDVHGLAEQFIEQHLGRNVVAAGFAGASGDIDPWFRVLPGFNTAAGWLPEPILLATVLGEEVVHVLRNLASPQRLNPPKRPQSPPAASGGDTPGCTASGGDTSRHTDSSPIRTAIKTLTLPPNPTKPSAAPPTFALTVGRVGEVAFVGLGGEVFHEIGLTIKTASPWPHTFILTHCNGAAGYLPAESAYSAGGYEVGAAAFAPSAAGLVIEEALALLHAL